jgi:hypothetical protein
LLFSRSSLPGVTALTVGSTHPDAAVDPQFLLRLTGLIENGLVADQTLQPLPIPGPTIEPKSIGRSTIPGPWPTIQVRGDP